MNKFFRKGISLALTLGMLFTASPGVWADDSDSSSGAAAPPESFSVYLNVDGSKEPTLVKTYTATEMKILAKESKRNYIADADYEKMTSNGTIYYTAANSYSLSCGRAVTEYIMIPDMLEDAGMTFDEGDYLIMGPDYTNDSQYSEYDLGTASENYSQYWKNFGWYSYDDLYGDRYYYQNWDESKKMKVPSIIALKSYGGSGWTAETFWQMYAGQSDYLWAYVVNFGQTNMTEETYNRFYHNQTECTIKLDKDRAVQPIVAGLLNDVTEEVKSELSETLTGTTASEIPEGSFWVTEAQRIALQNALDAYGAADIASDTTNIQAYSAYTSLNKALKEFRSAKQEGTKSGYAWFSAADYDTTQKYVIRTRTQLAELAELVKGTADTGAEMAEAYDFEGKTIELAADIDADRNRIIIGDAEHPFRGTFDGMDHEISDLRINRASGYAALFAVNEGVIKNLTLSGTDECSVKAENDDGSDAASAPVGGIAALNRGTIEDCVNKAVISAPDAAEAGGIAGRNEGIITRCLNAADITAYKNVGGIAGYLYGMSSDDENAAAAEVSSSLNAGNINALCSRTDGNHANSNAGGIVGGIGADMNVYPAINSCINAGSVKTAGKTAGGIVGGAWIIESSVRSCYSIGTVICSAEGYSADAENADDAYNIGAVVGRCRGTIEKCYWLEGKNSSGIGHAGSGVTPAQSVSSVDLQKLASDLGEEFDDVDNGYPVLKWQSVYQVGFDLSQKGFVDTHYAGEYLPCIQPADPQISGQHFNGWYTSADLKTLYDFNKPVTENMTIYAGFGGGSSSGGSGGGSSSGGSSGGSGGGGTSSGGNGAGSGSSASQGTLYSDVSSSDWFSDAVKYVSDKKLMTGTSASTFSPKADTTRGMLMTILARMSGEDTSGSSPWYKKGLEWALANGVSDGTSPEKLITREQLATMLYRYAGSPETNSSIAAFNDAESVSTYAQAAVKWAVEKGIVTGKSSNKLDPSSATRAEMAAMIQRYTSLTE